MTEGLNQDWNIFSFTFYFCVMSVALFICACLLEPELGGKVMFLSAVWSAFRIWQQRSMMRRHLRQHGDTHAFSPNLRRIVDEVCVAAGRDPARVPLYDYSLNRPQGEISKSVLRLLSYYLLVGRSHAAATTGDMLLVSESLLKLLDDAEEKAIIAHEMAHMVHNHHILSGLLWIVQMMVYHTIMVYWLLAVWQGGWAAVAIAFGLPFVLSAVFIRAYPAWKKKGGLTLDEVRERGWAQFLFTLVYYPLLFALLGYFAPAVIKAYVVRLLVTHATAIVAGLASQSRERQADAGAVELGANPLALAMALRKILFLQERAQQKLFERKSPLSRDGLLDAYAQLYSTHPPIEERVETLCQNAFRSGIPWKDMQQVRRGPIDLPADHDIPEDVVRAFNRM